MDFSTALTLIQTILQLLDSSSPLRREIESLWGYKSQLKKLENTISFIQAVLLEAERQQLHLNLPQQVSLKRLNEVLYDADDLLDEIATLVQRKNLISGNTVSKEVRLFFTRFNQLTYSFTKCHEIKKIRETLDDIERNHRQFGSMLTHYGDGRTSYVSSYSRKISSLLCEEDVIIGRDNDKRLVIDMLLETTVEESVSCVSIVGIGGLGKTTLAQLVYNDEKVKREFQARMWVCVSNDFDVGTLLAEILEEASKKPIEPGPRINQLQEKIMEELDGKKYLLVLDDVWNEDFNKWRKLKILLMGGARGSRVIVTTRSKRVAEVVGNLYMYELHGLSDDDSWNLFERMTLEAGQHQMKPYMVEIGKDIVRKCANVPLSIRVVGSLLRGQDEGRWRYLKNTDLANLKHVENDIVGTLKISYYYLPFHLKSCFSFCAIFPKHNKIKKDGLIRLWMAHGLIMPLDGESFEDAGEEYFMNLLQRCFFQEVERAESGEVLSCRMHDLIHDLAIELAGSEVLLLNNNTRCFDKNTRHLFINNNVTRIDFGEHLTKMKKLRTVIRVGYPTPLTSLDMLLLKARFLRVLDLRRTSFKKLPSKISRLLHLRYLDLSWNHKLLLLPDGITELYNLQTLMLRGCRSLAELPRDLKKLIQLRCLDIYDCSSMTHMPPGMNNMTCLHSLTMFLVGKTSNSHSLVPVNAGGLGDVKHLNNLTGTLVIRILGELEDEVVEAKRGGHLINKQNLTGLTVGWERKLLGSNSKEKDSEGSDAERILYGLQPHPNLRTFRLWDYPGVRFPCWGSLSMNLEICLPNLVEVEINEGKVLEHLPLFSRLHYLKSLELTRLRKLEYVERTASREDDLVFFRSLEKLVLGHLQELKGWREESGLEDQKKEILTVGRLAFPRLSHLHIWECWNLRSLPLCPNLEKLELNRFNPALCPIASRRNERTNFSGCNSTSNAQLQVSEGMKEVKIDKVGYLNSLPLESFKCLSSVVIRGDHEIERLATGEAGKVFQSGRFSSLQSLVISDCSKLKSLSGRQVWEHLTALESLQLKLLSELNLDDDDSDHTDISWRYLNRTLRSMLLWYLPKLVKLPKGMQQLTSLKSLQITNCDNFEILPSWISCFTSLQFLVLRNCGRLKSLPQEMSQLLSLQHLDIRDCSSELTERCLETTGADWPKIQHIPRIDVQN